MKTDSFRKGLLDGLPICLGYFPVSFAFGIFAVESGLSVFHAVLISMFCVTSAGQLAAVPIIAGSGGLWELAVSQLVINLRYCLMSISLSQKLDRSIKLPGRLGISFFNTDEIFAVASGQSGSVSKAYMFGLAVLPWVGWASGTLTGSIAGNILPPVVASSLGVAIYGMFIAIVVPEIRKSRSTALCVGVAVILSCLFYYIPALKTIPSGFTIIVCAVAASALLAWLAPIPEEVSENA